MIEMISMASSLRQTTKYSNARILDEKDGPGIDVASVRRNPLIALRFLGSGLVPVIGIS